MQLYSPIAANVHAIACVFGSTRIQGRPVNVKHALTLADLGFFLEEGG